MLGWDERLEFDVQYAENLSFILEIKILCKTFLHILKRKDVVVTPGTIVKPLNEVRENQKTTNSDLHKDTKLQ